MVESIYAWMQKTEQRFLKQSGSQSNRKNSRLRSDLGNSKEIERPGRKKSKAQLNTLDSFLPKTSSVLFDDGFSPADFRLLTRQWLDENLVAETD